MMKIGSPNQLSHHPDSYRIRLDGYDDIYFIGQDYPFIAKNMRTGSKELIPSLDLLFSKLSDDDRIFLYMTYKKAFSKIREFKKDTWEDQFEDLGNMLESDFEYLKFVPFLHEFARSFDYDYIIENIPGQQDFHLHAMTLFKRDVVVIMALILLSKTLLPIFANLNRKLKSFGISISDSNEKCWDLITDYIDTTSFSKTLDKLDLMIRTAVAKVAKDKTDEDISIIAYGIQAYIFTQKIVRAEYYPEKTHEPIPTYLGRLIKDETRVFRRLSVNSIRNV